MRDERRIATGDLGDDVVAVPIVRIPRPDAAKHQRRIGKRPNKRMQSDRFAREIVAILAHSGARARGG